MSANSRSKKFIDVARKGLGESSGLRVTVQDLSADDFSAGGGYPVDVSLRGQSWDHLGRSLRK